MSFTADADIQAAIIGTEGNGLKFLKVGSATPLKLEFDSYGVGSPYDTNTVGGPTEGWLLWGVWTLGVNSAAHGPYGLNRGRAYDAPYKASFMWLYFSADSAPQSPGIYQMMSLEYTGSTTVSNVWNSADSPLVVPAAYNSRTFALFARSFDDSGTMKIELSQDAQNWFIWDHGVTTTTSILPSNNKWSISMHYADTFYWSWAGIGETGFHNGAKTRADALQIYNYLNTKWDLDI